MQDVLYFKLNKNFGKLFKTYDDIGGGRNEHAHKNFPCIGMFRFQA